MPYLSPTTLTTDEQKVILRATTKRLRDHVIISLALGTGLRLGEIVGLNVGDVYAPNGTPRVRVRVRKEAAKRGRAGDVFLPDKLVTKLKRFRSWKKRNKEALAADAPLFCNQSGTRISKRRVQFAWRQWQVRGGIRSAISVSLSQKFGGNERLPSNAGLVLGSEVCKARFAAYDNGLY